MRGTRSRKEFEPSSSYLRSISRCGNGSPQLFKKKNGVLSPQNGLNIRKKKCAVKVKRMWGGKERHCV
jgi:hypothetical protein